MEKPQVTILDMPLVSQLTVLLLQLEHMKMMAMEITVVMSASIKTLMEPGQK